MLLKNMLGDTIIAISTPPGRGGIGIVRLSGDKALQIARKIFKPRSMVWRDMTPGYLTLGEVYDKYKNESLDEAYLAYFSPDRSYTKETVVEISSHGSPVVLEEILRLGTKAGARLAHPGEFTLRAYAHGRIDIIQAEAVNDLIMAGSLQQAKMSFGQVRGNLSRKIQFLRGDIIRLLARVEASLEFPEEGLEITSHQISGSLESVISSLRRLAASYERGKKLTQGVKLAIVGKANVGKSTLFNALLDEERAIVSPYPGTTRDYLRETIRIEDTLFHLTDMAGLGRASHAVEKEGIRRGREVALQSDGILLVLDSSRPEGRSDLALMREFRAGKVILLFNKSDLPFKIDKAKCLAESGHSRWLEISALRKTNLEKLKGLIHAAFGPEESRDRDVILHLRQKLLLEQMTASLEAALDAVASGQSEEVCAEEIRRALGPIGQLTGEIKADDIIQSIFSNFCLGK
jgi:tRNA modification GTPase